MNEILSTGIVPNNLKDVIISIIFKKGCKLDPGNYRGLSLIAHEGKVLERLIQNRLIVCAEKYHWLPEEQNGFRANRSTVDSIWIARTITSYAHEKRLPCFRCFIDLTKAYDKVNRAILWTLLKRLGVPDRMLALIIDIHEGAMASVRFDGELLEPFLLKSGLKQGSVFAPLLFNIFFGAIIFEIDRRLGDIGIKLRFRKGDNILSLAKMNNKKGFSIISIWKILFADDCAVFAETEADLQTIMDTFVLVTAAYGQELSFKKTEVLVVGPRRSPAPITASIIHHGNDRNHGLPYKAVTQFNYLGSTENDDASMGDELTKRINKATYSFNSLCTSVFTNKKVRLKTKLRTYNALILSTLLYGCQSWAITTTDIKKLEVLQQNCLRRILGIKWYDKITRSEVIQICNSFGVQIRPVETIIRERRLRWLGHIERAGPDHLLYIVLHSQANNGSRPRGKQPHAYRHAAVEDMKIANIDTKTWQTLALDRTQWRTAITQGVRAITTDWERRQAAERATRHAYNERNAVQRLFMQPAPQRTSRVDQLMQEVRAIERQICEQQGYVDVPIQRAPSRTAWIRQQLLAEDHNENEILTVRRALNNLTYVTHTPLPPAAPHF